MEIRAVSRPFCPAVTDDPGSQHRVPDPIGWKPFLVEVLVTCRRDGNRRPGEFQSPFPLSRNATALYY